MIREIIEEVGGRAGKADGRFAEFRDADYSPVEFSESNYREIEGRWGCPMVFVDGGNAELIGAPGISLQIVRTASISMKENRLAESRRQDFYVLATATGSGTSAVVFREGKKEAAETTLKPASFCETMRRVSEFRLAMDELGKGTVVMDGTLKARNSAEKSVIEELRARAVGENAGLVALAKTTSILTETGRPFASMLGRRSGAWHYHPVVRIDSERHPAEMFFVRLHEKSRHVFRAEVFREHGETIPKIAGELKGNSGDLAFPGYPYGLVLADRLARVSNEEAALLRTKLYAAAGSRWKDVERDLAAADAHQILDGM